MSQEEVENFRRIVTLKVISLLFIDITAIFGNALVCLSVHKNRRLRTKTGALISCLAISDLMFATTVVPMSAASIWNSDSVTKSPAWISDDSKGIACSVYGILMYSLTGLSVSTMAFAAVNRYFCIAHSNLYRKYFTFKMIGITLLLMFLSIIILLVCLAAPGYGRFEFLSSFAQCMLHFKPRYLYMRTYIEITALTIWGLIPFSTIIIFYLLIYFYVRRHNRKIGTRLATLARPASLPKHQPVRQYNNFITEETTKDKETPNPNDEKPVGEAQKQHNTESTGIMQNNEMTNTELSTELTIVVETTTTTVTTRQKTTTTGPNMAKIPTKNVNLNSNVRATKSEVKITKILLAVFLGFCFCWIPTIISHVINVASNYKRNDVTIMSLYSVSLSTAINPFIYGVGNREFRNTYIKLLTCKKFV